MSDKGHALEFHPFADIFPLIDDKAFEGLVADIRENGLYEPIVLHEGMILDGRNRYRACGKAGVKPITKQWDQRGDPLAFVVSKNLHRRHLNESQRAMAADKIANMRSGARTDLPQICGRSNGQASVSQPEAAKLMNVGLRTVQSARIVRANGVPELQQAVETGAIAITPAEKIARQPPEEQKRIVSETSTGVGYKIQLPSGVHTLEEWCRQGLELERINKSTALEAVADKIGMSRQTYLRARELILLSDYADLSLSDKNAVDAALHDLNSSRRVAKPVAAIAHISEKVWGGKKIGRDADKKRAKRVEAFEMSLEVVVQACSGICNVEIPYLGSDLAKDVGMRIRKSKEHLTRFESRLKEACK